MFPIFSQCLNLTFLLLSVSAGGGWRYSLHCAVIYCWKGKIFWLLDIYGIFQNTKVPTRWRVIVGVHKLQSPFVSVLSKSKSSALPILSLTAHVSHCVSPTNKQAAFLLGKYFITFHLEFMLPCDQANGQ